MTRLWLRIAIALTTGFMLYTGIIHMQSDQITDLRALLTPPENCAAPCFLGIQPGTTTIPDALNLLKVHPWIAGINLIETPNASESSLMILKWSGMQSPLIDPQGESAFYGCGELICGVSIATKVELGNLLLVFGEPDSATIRSIPGGADTRISYAANYDPMQLTIRLKGRCPPMFTAMMLQRSPVTFQMGFVDSQESTMNLRSARFQVINFQKQPYPWLQRRAFICNG